MTAGVSQGLITDEQGEPIIGATVKEQGTGNGTISDLEGRFSLEADSEGVLQVSYVGFATQELPVSGRRDFRITSGKTTRCSAKWSSSATARNARAM